MSDESLANDEPGLEVEDEEFADADLLAAASELGAEVGDADSDDDAAPEDDDGYGFYDDESEPHAVDDESEEDEEPESDEPDPVEEPKAEPATFSELDHLRQQNLAYLRQIEHLSRQQAAPKQPAQPTGPDPRMVSAVRTVMRGDTDELSRLDPVLKDRASDWIRQTNERQLQREFNPQQAYGQQIAPFVAQHLEAELQRRLAPYQQLLADRRVQQATGQLAPYKATFDEDPSMRSKVAEFLSDFDTDSMKPEAVKKLLAVAVSQAQGGPKVGRKAQKKATRKRQDESNRAQRRSRGGRGRGRGTSKPPKFDAYTDLSRYAVDLDAYEKRNG